MRKVFVRKTIEGLLKKGHLDRKHSVLTVCAGAAEAELFKVLAFENVTVTNITPHANDDRVKPYTFELADIQKLPYEDNSYDFVFVSDGLHHCGSPHHGLVEMLRVARIGIIVFEARDSLLMRLVTGLKLINPYECAVVMSSKDLAYGGLDNTCVPNYVYRWTEREFKKTVFSAQPYGAYTFHFAYGLNIAPGKNVVKKNSFAYWLLKVGDPVLRLLTLLFRKQRNSFAMVAIKPALPEQLWPWLQQKDGELAFSEKYASQHS